jgi:type IV pilus assembly protein PilA
MKKGCLILFALFVIAAIAVPILSRSARTRAQEVAALGDIQTIHTGQTQYHSQFGRYATSLDELGPPTSEKGPARADLVPAGLASGTNGGYQFTLQGGPSVYTINANPLTFNETGRRTFYSDETQVVREIRGPEPASAASSPIR